MNLFEVCQLYCSSCHKNFSFKTLSMQVTPQSNCQECKDTQLEPIYFLQMLAQDPSLMAFSESAKKRRG